MRLESSSALIMCVHTYHPGSPIYSTGNEIYDAGVQELKIPTSFLTKQHCEPAEIDASRVGTKR